MTHFCYKLVNRQQRKSELQRASSSGSLIMRDQSMNGSINCPNNAPQQLISSEGSTMPSITSPLHSHYTHQQQHSPEFNTSINGIRPRTSSNASSITGFDCDTFQFRDRSASNASSCGGNIGVAGHLSPPSLIDYSEQDSITSGVGKVFIPNFCLVLSIMIGNWFSNLHFNF